MALYLGERSQRVCAKIYKLNNGENIGQLGFWGGFTNLVGLVGSSSGSLALVASSKFGEVAVVVALPK